jgi:cobalamin biosynthesis Co2+ chelatase CbiK
MYEYKYVSLKTGFWTGKPKEDYKKVIEENARQGWRFVQMVVFVNHGTNSNYELIFERVI